MSLPVDMEDIPTDILLQRVATIINNRNQARLDELCPYCKRHIAAETPHECKYKDGGFHDVFYSLQTATASCFKDVPNFGTCKAVPEDGELVGQFNDKDVIWRVNITESCGGHKSFQILKGDFVAAFVHGPSKADAFRVMNVLRCGERCQASGHDLFAAAGKARDLLRKIGTLQANADYMVRANEIVEALNEALIAFLFYYVPGQDGEMDLHDLWTHRDAWRSALEGAKKDAEVSMPVNVRYWQHEIDAFDRLYKSLETLAPASKFPAPPPVNDPNESPFSERNFILFVNVWRNRIHEWAVEKGWHKPGVERNVGEEIALIHSELSEALEYMRAKPDTRTIERTNSDGVTVMYAPSDHIEGFAGIEEEYADVIVRILQSAKPRGLRVAEAFIAKVAFNQGRPYQHGGKAF